MESKDLTLENILKWEILPSQVHKMKVDKIFDRSNYLSTDPDTKILYHVAFAEFMFDQINEALIFLMETPWGYRIIVETFDEKTIIGSSNYFKSKREFFKFAKLFVANIHSAFWVQYKTNKKIDLASIMRASKQEWEVAKKHGASYLKL